MRPIDYKTLQVGDEVVTRDGRKGRVLATDIKNPHYGVVCRIEERNGIESVSEYTQQGHYFDGDERSKKDIFLPPKVKFINVYYNEDGNRGVDHGFYFGLSSYPDEVTAVIDGMQFSKDEPSSKFIKTIEVEI